MAKNSTVKNSTQSAVPVKKKGHAKLYIGLGIFAIILLGAAYFYLTFLSGGILPLAFNTVQNQSSLAPAILSKIQSYPQLNVSYAGSISQGSDPPLAVIFTKFQNNYKVHIGIPNPTTGKPYNLDGISLNNGTQVYLCSGYSGTTYPCKTFSGSPYQLAEQMGEDLGLGTGLQNTKIISLPTPSYYNGSPCFQISGSDVIQNAHGFLLNATSANLSFTGCISAKYYVPLYLNATITPSSGQAIRIYLYSVGIFKMSNDSAITNMPGMTNSSA